MNMCARRLAATFVVVGALLCIPAAAVAQTVKDDPAIGNWVLNYEKSKFEGAAVPDKRVMKIEAVGDAIKETIDTLNGVRWDRIEFTAKYDGKDVPISNSALSFVALKRIDKNTVERTGKYVDKVVETRTRVVSPDGKLMTITTVGKNEDMTWNTVQVFDREK